MIIYSNINTPAMPCMSVVHAQSCQPWHSMRHLRPQATARRGGGARPHVYVYAPRRAFRHAAQGLRMSAGGKEAEAAGSQKEGRSAPGGRAAGARCRPPSPRRQTPASSPPPWRPAPPSPAARTPGQPAGHRQSSPKVNSRYIYIHVHIRIHMRGAPAAPA